jgi:hypothetical protein
MANPRSRRFGAGGLLLAASAMVAGSMPVASVARAVSQRAYVQKAFFRVTSGSSVSVWLRRPTTAAT